MEEQDKELPKGWVTAQLGDLAEYINGFAFKPAHWGAEGKPIIRIQNLTDPNKEYNFTTYEVDEKYFISKGEILVSWSATLDAFIWDGPDALLNQHIFKVIPSAQLDKGYVFYLLKNSIDELIYSEHLHGTTMKHINRKPFLSHKIGLAPIQEQQRIVDKIETLFSELDNGEENLRQAQKLIASYRQSVLLAAVTGELTKDWREANQQLESGEDLLERILIERREQWQGKGKYKEPQSPDTTDLPELPEGWGAATIDQLASSVDYGSSSKCNLDSEGIPVLRMGNILEGKLILDKLKYLPVDHDEFPRLLLQEQDLLFNRTNSAELVGKTAVYKGNPEKCSFASYLIRVRFIDSESDFISAFINSLYGKEWIRRVVSQQVGQANVNGTKLKALAVPLPSREEQEEIVQRMNDILSQISALETWCDAELTRSMTLRQSILKDAFSGQLVPQDETEESASILLDRIRAERTGVNQKQESKSMENAA